MNGDLSPLRRVPLLILGFISLGFGVGAGLARLGWHFPLPAPELVALHGPLMVSGFFGTLISLERAVALARPWAYVGPLLTGLGGITLIIGLPMPIGSALITLGSAILLFASFVVVARQNASFTLTLALGATSWFIGNLLWLLGGAIPTVILWWAAFLVLTIAGERLELSRFIRPPPVAETLFGVIVLALLIALALNIAMPVAGLSIFSASLIATALWLARFDIARRTVRDRGLTRYIAVSLLSGYAWLATSGILGLLYFQLPAGVAANDAFLHALFLGFVFSMVFGHAPLIFPAVTRFAVPYHPVFYSHLILLHLSLAARLTGDLVGMPGLRALAGAANGLTIALFVFNTVTAVIRGRRIKTPPQRADKVLA